MKSIQKIIFLSVFLIVLSVSLKSFSESKEQKKNPVELWSQTCARCHAMRSPSDYSDPSWDIIVDHMRLRANLTKEEAETIKEFLKSSN